MKIEYQHILQILKYNACNTKQKYYEFLQDGLAGAQEYFKANRGPPWLTLGATTIRDICCTPIL